MTKILGEHGIEPTLRLSARYPKLALRTQYGESDYDFVRRLLAEAGISFDLRRRSELVLSDAPEQAEPVAGSPVPFLADPSLARGLPYVTDVDVSAGLAPARATFRDHDFRRPRYALTGTHAVADAPHALLEDYRYVPGHSLAGASAAREPVADGRGTYRHDDQEASSRARRHMEAERANQTRVAFATSRVDLAPGRSSRSRAPAPRGPPEQEPPRHAFVD